jgi:two-component system sensor histidine kinase DesK
VAEPRRPFTGPDATFATFGQRQGRFRPFFVVVALVFLAIPVSEVLSGRNTPLHLGLALVALALIAGTFFPALLFRQYRLGRDGIAAPIASLVVAAIGAYLLVATHSGSWITLLYFAAIGGSRILPGRRALALLVVIGAIAAAGLQAAGDDLGSAFVQGLSVSLIGLTVFGIATLQRANAQLLAARDEIGRLAVAEERARIARDLHDTLGHDLSVIALKSELAGRLVASDPARASAEILDVQRVAREALGSVRETVSGYRRPTLDAELSEVRSSLAAAGINVTVTRDQNPLPEPVEAVLAWVVREGSTNILRHSETSRASIRIGRAGADAVAEITDDGPSREAVGAPDAAGGPGHGLAGLRERVARFGGRMDAGPTGSGGYRLHVAVPIAAAAAPAVS